MATTKNGIYYPNNYDTVADVPADLKKMAESIDAIVKEESEKNSAQGTKIANLEADNEINKSKISANEQSIGILQQKDETHDTDIEELQLENERLQERVELQEENMLSGEETGEAVNLPESADYFCKVKVQGNSKQKVTEQGANIIDLTKRNVNYSSSGVKDIVKNVNDLQFTVEANTTNQNVRFRVKFPAGTYYVQRKYEVVSGTTTSQTGKLYIQGLDFTVKAVILQSETKKSFTLEQEEEVYIGFIGTESVATTDELKVRFYDFMISTEDVEFEEFVPDSPSKDYPAEIKNINENIKILMTNENFFTTNNLKQVTSVATYEQIDENSFKLKSGGTSWNRAIFRCLNPAKNKDLVFKYSQEDTNGTNYYLTIDGIKDGVTTRLTSQPTLQYGFNSKDYDEFDIALHCTREKAIENTAIISNIMLKLDETTEDFIPHKEQTVTFPLEEGQRLHNKDYLADNGIHHKRKTVVLNGTEAWALSTQNEYQWFRYNLAGTKKGTDFICTHLKNYANIGNYIGISNNNAEDRVYIAISEEITTVEQLKTWLASNNLTVEYELAQEEIEEYTEGQKQAYKQITELKTYKGQSNAYTDTIAILDVEYKKDLETVINNLQATILASEEV